MTATASLRESDTIINLCDMRDPAIIRLNPVTQNHLYYKIKRPPSINGFRGKDHSKPSTLQLLNMLVLDNFIECIKNDRDPKITIIFVQSFKEMNIISDYLRVQLREKLRGKKKPWIENHSAVGTLTKLSNQKRMEAGGIIL